MPSPNELIGIVVLIFVIWLVLKLAKVAFKLILFVMSVLLLFGVVYFLFLR